MPQRAISAWIVPLKGHEFDFEDLPIYLQGSPVSVVKRGPSYFLRLSAEVTGPSHEHVTAIAEEYVALVNGLSAVLLQGVRPCELEGGAYFGIDSADNVAHTVVPVGTAEARCKAGHLTILVNGVAQPDSRLGTMTGLLRAAIASPPKADALAIVGRTLPSWSELYLVFELVEANVGRRMYEERWISRADAKVFGQTANSYTALGRAGRHGKDRGNPPKAPMAQPEALKLMRALVGKWLEDRVSSVRDA